MEDHPYRNRPPFASYEKGVLTVRGHVGQQMAMQSKKRIIVLLGGRQSGKSSIGPYWLLNEMKHRGPGEYMVVAPTFPLLDASAVPKMVQLFCQWLNIGVMRQNPTLQIKITPAGEEFLWGHRQKEPTRIIFGYATKPESLEARTLLAAWLDEAGQDEFKLASWEALMGRMTTTLGRALITTTPYSFNWLKTTLYDVWEKANHDHKYIDVIQFKSILNPNFPEEEYWRQKEVLEYWKWNMFYNAVFTIPSGIIYENFAKNVKTQSIPRLWQRPPQTWNNYLGLDFGGIHTCGLYLAQDPDNGNLYLYDTYFPFTDPNQSSEASIAIHAENIKKKADFFDRAAGGAKSEQQWRDEFWRYGIPVEEPEISDVEVGITRVQGFMARKQLFIFDDQNGVLNEIFSYQRKVDPDGNPDPKGEIKNKSQFHHLDALRYILGQISNFGYLEAGQTGGERELLDKYQAEMGQLWNGHDLLNQGYLMGQNGPLSMM